VIPCLQLTVGGRLDYWSTFDGASNSFGAIGVQTYPDRTDTSYNGKLAALYQLTNGTTLRASVGNAFRNPTVYDLYRTWNLSGVSYLSNPYLKPEHLRSWEAGVRQKIGGRLQLEGTYYENRVSNLIYSSTDYVTDPTGKTVVKRNAGESRTRGLELSGKEKLLPWLELTASYTFNDAEITQNAAIPASVGKQVTRVPRNVATGMLIASRGRWNETLSERYVGHVYGTDLNTEKHWGVPGAYDGYNLVAASVNYNIDKRLTAFGSVDNLLDRYYYQYYVSPGRTAMGGLRLHF
jgi:iron complex outermembrane recepter protein